MPSHFTLRMQFGPHQDPEEVTGRGERFPATLNGSTVTLARPLYEWEFVVIQS